VDFYHYTQYKFLKSVFILTVLPSKLPLILAFKDILDFKSSKLMLESFETTHIYDYYQIIFLSLNLYLCKKKGKNVLTKRSNIVRILLNNMIPSRPCLLNCIFFL